MVWSNLSFLERELWQVDQDRLVEVAVVQLVVQSENSVPVVTCPQSCCFPGLSDLSKPVKWLWLQGAIMVTPPTPFPSLETELGSFLISSCCLSSHP